LQELLPKLEVAKAETAEQIIVVDAKKTEVAEKTKLVEAEEAIAKDKKQKADAIQKDCEFELSRVMPIYNLAIRAVGQLKKDDITELKGFAKPPDAAVIVVQTLVILFEMPVIKKAEGNTKVPDWWESGKKHVLSKKDLLGECKNFKKDEIKPELIIALKPIIESPGYEDGILQGASRAAWGLGKWVRAMVQYDEAMKIVKPKQIELAEAKSQSAEA
jgi:dynein heavy chain